MLPTRSGKAADSLPTPHAVAHDVRLQESFLRAENPFAQTLRQEER
jgi:hypothetical protein